MVFTVTARHVNSAGANGSSQTHVSNSVAESADSLLLVGFGSETDAANVVPAIQTPVGGGLTYNLIGKAGESPTLPWAGDSTFLCSGSLWRAAVGGSPAAHTITCDAHSGTTLHFGVITALDITGHDVASPIVQSKVASQALGSASDTAAGTVTLDAAPTPGNLVVLFAFASADSGGAFAAPTAGGQSMTQVHNQNGAFIHNGMWSRVWTGAESSNVLTSSDLGQQVGSWMMVAVEIAADAGGAAPGAILLESGAMLLGESSGAILLEA